MTGELWVVVAALAVVAMIGIVMGRRLVRFTLEIFGLRVDTRGDRPQSGVDVTRSRAGRNIVALTRGEGRTRVRRSSAGGDIQAMQGAEQWGRSLTHNLSADNNATSESVSPSDGRTLDDRKASRGDPEK